MNKHTQINKEIKVLGIDLAKQSFQVHIGVRSERGWGCQVAWELWRCVMGVGDGIEPPPCWHGIHMRPIVSLSG